jgi:NADH:ubiquinone oxidoreductase subunit C
MCMLRGLGAKCLICIEFSHGPDLYRILTDYEFESYQMLMDFILLVARM